MAISFIHTQILVNLHVNKTNFHTKRFALGLVLKQRWKATRKLPIGIRKIVCNKCMCSWQLCRGILTCGKFSTSAWPLVLHSHPGIVYTKHDSITCVSHEQLVFRTLVSSGLVQGHPVRIDFISSRIRNQSNAEYFDNCNLLITYGSLNFHAAAAPQDYSLSCSTFVCSMGLAKMCNTAHCK